MNLVLGEVLSPNEAPGAPEPRAASQATAVVVGRPRRRPAPPFATPLSDDSLRQVAERLDGAPAADIVRWATTMFGRRLAIAASMTDAVLIDVASRVAPGIEVIFLDTQYHFQETLATAEAIRDRYPIRLRVVWPDVRPDNLWRTDPDACCHARKVLPMERALRGRVAWLSGLRRADSRARAHTPVVQRDRRGLVKVNPLAAWSDEDVAGYIAAHDVPVNPLVDRGFPSIGCWPCTAPAGSEAT
ncbi:MAG TPA: phosphoadenylyl-sulfate reductase, partial [Acidimicrobiales bacterium]